MITLGTVRLFAGRTALLAQKMAPEIFLAMGIGLGIGAAYSLSKTQIRAKEIKEEMHEDLEVIQANVDSGQDYPKEEIKQDLLDIYIDTGKEYVKLFGPSLIMGAASITFILASHGIIKGRNAALMAAYKGLDEAYSRYRSKVREELGEAKDSHFRFGDIKNKKGNINSDALMVDGKEVPMRDPNKHLVSDYHVWITKDHLQFKNDYGLNIFWIQTAQNWLNDQLNINGHVFLNEAYDALHLPRTKAGAVVGWLKDGPGDGFIDFGLTQWMNDGPHTDNHGEVSPILVDFNVDGVIWDLI
jgi:hypothetical protein